MEYWKRFRSRIFHGYSFSFLITPATEPITSEELAKGIHKYAYKELIEWDGTSDKYLQEYLRLVARGFKSLGPEIAFQICKISIAQATCDAYCRN